MTDLVDRVAARRSSSKVTDEAPSHDELLRLVAAAGRVADHSGLEPWRLIELRGRARERLGRALADAAGDDKSSSKPLRAPLLIAIVVSPRESKKVPAWEQEATASGVAHMLNLLLADSGWGSMWRTGSFVRSEPVHRMHALSDHEYLLGWLYVGGVPEAGTRAATPLDPARFLETVDD
ncbi:nitroreductase family protein [Paramicrobacterium agarici]|uniref:Putative NAD(P)H nitroreductase n=1 Tax=Paramicrobacterium agarici TaxID=630514 RepID=A0A2A9DW16_9MICO|nr:nitroreductase family protein [Microbacterium agarici]PFG30793.1 nitroreductase [Microbacterium agarici]TQO23860.1 nitroreductase [Microbacterium agarici]